MKLIHDAPNTTARLSHWLRTVCGTHHNDHVLPAVRSLIGDDVIDRLVADDIAEIDMLPGNPKGLALLHLRTEHDKRRHRIITDTITANIADATYLAGDTNTIYPGMSPDIAELLNNIQCSGCTFAASVDLEKSFYQVPIPRAAWPRFTIVSEKRRAVMKRLPMGYVRAVEILQAIINTLHVLTCKRLGRTPILTDLYVDNICVFDNDAAFLHLYIDTFCAIARDYHVTVGEVARPSSSITHRGCKIDLLPNHCRVGMAEKFRRKWVQRSEHILRSGHITPKQIVSLRTAMHYTHRVLAWRNVIRDTWAIDNIPKRNQHVSVILTREIKRFVTSLHMYSHAPQPFHSTVTAVVDASNVALAVAYAVTSERGTVPRQPQIIPVHTAHGAIAKAELIIAAQAFTALHKAGHKDVNLVGDNAVAAWAITKRTSRALWARSMLQLMYPSPWHNPARARYTWITTAANVADHLTRAGTITPAQQIQAETALGIAARSLRWLRSLVPVLVESSRLPPHVVVACGEEDLGTHTSSEIGENEIENLKCQPPSIEMYIMQANPLFLH